MKIIVIIIILILIPALIFTLPDKRHFHDSYKYYTKSEEQGKGTAETESEDPKEEDEKEGEEEKAEEIEKEAEEQQSGGGYPGGGYSGGSQGDEGGQNQSQGDDPVPAYPYFVEGGKLICMGCYRPFANVYELNAHVCEGMHTGECDHEWEAEYHDVWIEATGHYEYGVIVEAYDEPVYEEMCVCRKCGAYFQNSEEAADHIIAVHGNEGSWTVADVITGYIHHEAVYGDVFVTDTQAHWERQVYRYHCIKCGEIRYPD